MGLTGRKDGSRWGAARKGYVNEMVLELGHADGGEWHSRWKEQNEQSHRSQREADYCGTYWKSRQPRYALWAL